MQTVVKSIAIEDEVEEEGVCRYFRMLLPGGLCSGREQLSYVRSKCASPAAPVLIEQPLKAHVGADLEEQPI